MVKEWVFASAEAMFAQACAACSAALQQGVDQRGKATLFASGGSTPAPLYQQLSRQPLRWEHIQVALVDERWDSVPGPANNAWFVAQHLLQNYAANASLLGMQFGGNTIAQDLQACEFAYRQLPTPYDVVILGMGPDGHIASLFPQADGLAPALDLSNPALCAAIQAKPSEVTGPHTARLSLSLSAILQARQVYLLLLGAGKRAVYEQAKQENTPAALPVSALLKQQQVEVQVYWAP